MMGSASNTNFNFTGQVDTHTIHFGHAPFGKRAFEQILVELTKIRLQGENNSFMIRLNQRPCPEVLRLSAEKLHMHALCWPEPPKKGRSNRIRDIVFFRGREHPFLKPGKFPTDKSKLDLVMAIANKNERRFEKKRAGRR